MTQIKKILGGLAALVVAGGTMVVTAAPSDAQADCRPFANTPFSPGRHEIAGEAGQTGRSCPGVTYEILVKIDAALAPDPTVARVRGDGANFTNVARGECGPPTGEDTRGFYTELRINGENVAQSSRILLDGCRA